MEIDPPYNALEPESKRDENSKPLDTCIELVPTFCSLWLVVLLLVLITTIVKAGEPEVATAWEVFGMVVGVSIVLWIAIACCFVPLCGCSVNICCDKCEQLEILAMKRYGKEDVRAFQGIFWKKAPGMCSICWLMMVGAFVWTVVVSIGSSEHDGSIEMAWGLFGIGFIVLLMVWVMMAVRELRKRSGTSNVV